MLRTAPGIAGIVLSMAVPFAVSANAQQFSPSSDGVVVKSGAISLRVTALRDDVLRVRIWQGDNAPEDASWAVLPVSRTSSVQVHAESRGFVTDKLRVSVDDQLRLKVTDLSGNVLQEDAAPVHWDGTQFTVSELHSRDDHFFGLGDKPGPLDRAGQTFTMWNSDSFGWQESTDPIYKSIPYFIKLTHGRALGVFLDNTWRTNFDFGHANPARYSFGAVDGRLDYYLMYGPEPKQVVSEWAWLTGPTPLPPMWALGFQQSRYTYFPATQLREVADRLRKDRIPADVLWLDIDFQHEKRPFTVNEEAYPNFSGMVQDLGRENFKLVVITDPHVAKQPNAGYAPYDSGTAGDHFVKNPDGSTYVGKVWPGAAVFPDFTQAQTRKWWGTLYKTFVNDGVAGFWNDMDEPAVFETPGKTMPDNVQHRIDEPGFKKRTATHLEIHNLYGLETSRATYEGELALRPNERPYVMTRASYAGGQRYANTWTGDNSATWNHLSMTVPQLVNLGLSGFSLAGADVGGFAGSPTPDLLTKWIELAAFQPIDRDHSDKKTRMHEVWVDGPEHEAIRRHFIEERYRLMPYLYTVAEETSRNGLPINRPLFLEFPHATKDGTPIDLSGRGEFLFGSRILVAPGSHPDDITPYDVELPPGTWYDYWTGEQFVRGTSAGEVDHEQTKLSLARKPIKITPKLEELPVYVRGGSILPIAPLTQSTSEIPQGPLTLRVYPLAQGLNAAGEVCEGEVYSDDGHTFAYRQGEFARIRFTCSLAADGSLNIAIGKQDGTWKPWWHEYRVEVVGWAPKGDSAVDGQSKSPTQENGRWGITVSANPSGSAIKLR